LLKIKSEIDAMKSTLDPKLFKPYYPKSLLDWPEDSDLKEFLLEVSYQYSRLG